MPKNMTYCIMVINVIPYVLSPNVLYLTDLYYIKSSECQECYSSIENNSRCMLYKHLKPVYSMENYLKCNYHRDFRQYLTKLRLSSHTFLVERGRWVKPKINYHERLCTLCDENDIEDEYHILMKCKYFVNLREKYISKKYYKRPNMYKFQKLMNTTKRELYRLMLFFHKMYF